MEASIKREGWRRLGQRSDPCPRPIIAQVATANYRRPYTGRCSAFSRPPPRTIQLQRHARSSWLERGPRHVNRFGVKEHREANTALPYSSSLRYPRTFPILAPSIQHLRDILAEDAWLQKSRGLTKGHLVRQAAHP